MAKKEKLDKSLRKYNADYVIQKGWTAKQYNDFAKTVNREWTSMDSLRNTSSFKKMTPEQKVKASNTILKRYSKEYDKVTPAKAKKR